MIDAHAHIFNYIDQNKSIKLNWLPGSAGSDCTVSYTPEMLIKTMDKASVAKAVLLQGPYYGELNEYVLKAVQKFPDRFIGALYIDPWDNANIQMLDLFINQPEFTAVKLECSVPTGFLGLHKNAFLGDERSLALFERIEKSGHVLTLDLGAVGTKSYQTQAVRNIAERFNNLKIVICHLGQPNPSLDSDKELFELWKQQVELGLIPNVWFDTASIPAYFFHESYPFPGAGRYFKEAIKIIGPEKIMWGTDISGLLVDDDYKRLMGLADIYMTGFNQEEKEKVITQNALKVYFER